MRSFLSKTLFLCVFFASVNASAILPTDFTEKYCGTGRNAIEAQDSFYAGLPKTNTVYKQVVKSITKPTIVNSEVNGAVVFKMCAMVTYRMSERLW